MLFCTAVFLATMAAAPSHIVILRANRSGTINRLRAGGNGARRPIRPAYPYDNPVPTFVPHSTSGNPPGIRYPPVTQRDDRGHDTRGIAIRVNPRSLPSPTRRRAVFGRPRSPRPRTLGRSERRGWGRVAS
ncbi:hypothetical protein EF902_32470 [Streptomyces sp. WAC05858]|nr:hypothetical protein EF902_32470 [Streptomyces sp. WAC05858]